jgi:putative transposase
MAGVFKLKITETASELKILPFQQKTAFGKERVQALYLLKLRKVKTVQELYHFLLKRQQINWYLKC